MISAQTIIIAGAALLIGWQWGKVASVGSGVDGVDSVRDFPLLLRRLKSAITITLVAAALFVTAEIVADLEIRSSGLDLSLN